MQISKLIAFILIAIQASVAFSSNKCEALFATINSSQNETSVRDLIYGRNIRYLGIYELARVYKFDFSAFAKAYYRDKKNNIGMNFLKVIEKINPDLRNLVFHPGIVLRQAEFFEFLEKNPFYSRSSEMAYKEFKKHFGTEKYFRALVLTENEYLNLTEKKENMLPKNLQLINRHAPDISDQVVLSDNSDSHFSAKENISFENINLKEKGLFEMAEDQFSHSFSKLLFSVSKIKELAISVGLSVYYSQGPAIRAKRSIYIFELQLPQLDALFFQKLSSETVAVFDNSFNIYYKAAYSPDVESFVFVGINQSEIISSRKVDPEVEFYKFKFEK